MTKSLDAPSKSFGCVFLHFSSAFYLVSRSILPRKLEQFGCPVNFLAWLTDYLPTEISAQDMEKTNLPCCWIFPESFKELVVCHYLFSTYISDPRASSLGNYWNWRLPQIFQQSAYQSRFFSLLWLESSFVKVYGMFVYLFSVCLPGWP